MHTLSHMHGCCVLWDIWHPCSWEWPPFITKQSGAIIVEVEWVVNKSPNKAANVWTMQLTRWTFRSCCSVRVDQANLDCDKELPELSNFSTEIQELWVKSWRQSHSVKAPFEVVDGIWLTSNSLAWPCSLLLLYIATIPCTTKHSTASAFCLSSTPSTTLYAQTKVPPVRGPPLEDLFLLFPFLSMVNPFYFPSFHIHIPYASHSMVYPISPLHC